MLLSTQGLVLHTFPYSESSLIVRVFTERMGVKSYVIKGARKATSRVQQALLQPLSWLDMVVYDNPRTPLNYIKEFTPLYHTAESDQVTNALMFFMDELLYRTLREGEPMPELFRYAQSTTQALKQSNNQTIKQSSIPLTFLITVAKHMGIAPLNNYCIHEPCFSIPEGRFVSGSVFDATPHGELDLVPEDVSSALHDYLEAVYTNTAPPNHSLSTRTQLIAVLIDYYKHHLAYFGKFTSHEILHTVLS